MSLFDDGNFVMPVKQQERLEIAVGQI